MKLVSYESKKQLRPGVVEGELVVDIETALDVIAERRSANSKLNAAVRTVRIAGEPPRDLIDLLDRGPRYRVALSAITQSLAEDHGLKKSPKGLFTALGSARLRAPIPRPPKITCVGLNYADHAREQGNEPPRSPIYFLKSVNTICRPGDPVRVPAHSVQVDYEAEFAVVIGGGGRDIPEEKAYGHFAGYLILNDVSARDFQFADQQ